MNKECILYNIVFMASVPILIMSWSDRSSLAGVELPSLENSLFGSASRELGISLGRFGYSFAVSLALIQ